MAHKLYGKSIIYERHRHRYEINPDFIPEITSKGLKFTGVDDKKERMEVRLLKFLNLLLDS